MENLGHSSSPPIALSGQHDEEATSRIRVVPKFVRSEESRTFIMGYRLTMNEINSLSNGSQVRPSFSWEARVSKGARVQRNSSTVMRVWKQWTEEHRTIRKTYSGRRKVTSSRDDRHLLRMAVNYGTAPCRQLKARWSTATGVQMSASTTTAVPWIACKSAFIQDPLHGKPSTAASAMGS
ncbi:transposable element Tc1 transposase [Trichonephila clavipes]|nr:transposable element Tc1 transposase [Trichonephila clavipes]